MNRKGVTMLENWPETLALALLIIGLALSLASGSAFLSYILIILCGGAAGRLWFSMNKSWKFAGTLLISGFLVGFLLGSYYANKIILTILFFVGAILSYYLHERKIIKSLVK